MATYLIWEDDAGETKSVRFDVVSTETHELLNVITEHPVETGANISDHVRPELERVSLEGYVSNKPLYSNPGVEEIMDFSVLELTLPEQETELPITPGAVTRAVVGAVGSLFDSKPTSANVLNGTDFVDRVRAMYDDLKDARDNHRIIRLETALHEYDSMVIERLAIPRSVQDGTGATFQVDLKQIRTVTSETVAAPEPAEARGQATVSAGSKSGDKNNDAKKSERLQSIAAGLKDGAGASLKDLVGFGG